MPTPPRLLPSHPLRRGLVLHLPWNQSPADRQGGFTAAGFFELLKQGGVSPPSWYRDPRFGLVPDFANDTSNRALSGTALSLEPANLAPLSITAWVWPHVIEDNATVLGKWVTNQAGWLLRLRLSSSRPGLRFEVQHQTTALVVTIDQTGLYAANQWTHVAVTWDGTTTAANVILYVNGVPNTNNRTNQNGAGARKDDANRPLMAGASNLVEPVTGKFKGRLGPVKVWNRVLSGEEIVQDFLAPELTEPARLTRRRRFDLVGSPDASSIVEAERQTSWDVGTRVEFEAFASWAVLFLGGEVEAERTASWSVATLVLVGWPRGPVNKPQLGEYELRLITPRLIELRLVHTNNAVGTRPSRWNFVAPDWITLNALPAPAEFTVRQVP